MVLCTFEVANCCVSCHNDVRIYTLLIVCIDSFTHVNEIYSGKVNDGVLTQKALDAKVFRI